MLLFLLPIVAHPLSFVMVRTLHKECVTLCLRSPNLLLFKYTNTIEYEWVRVGKSKAGYGLQVNTDVPTATSRKAWKTELQPGLEIYGKDLDASRNLFWEKEWINSNGGRLIFLDPFYASTVMIWMCFLRV